MNAQFFFVYLLASKPRGTLYVGVTNNLKRRLDEHRSGAVPGFTRTYAVHQLVWFEVHDSLEQARRREKTLKKWNRAWKFALIEEGNPDWRDLTDALDPML
ncbi:MAG: GIY-YIG nuclease family protein [Oceanicaulis sp.]|jgi:putative endonuclease|nr:GIY-YIG nuclease family protein [Oceanicaulis sp.]